MSSLDSIDAMLAACADHGQWTEHAQANVATGTASVSTAGGVDGRRGPSTRRLVIPAVTAPVVGCWITTLRAMFSRPDMTLVSGLEYLLGTIDLNGGGESNKAAMPSKTIKKAGTVEAAVQTGAMLIAVAVRTAVTGTPNVTITYTNQDGTTGHTANLILPATPAVETLHLIAPHLQAGDTGIREVTGITKSAGTAGILDIYGMLPLQVNAAATGSTPMGTPLDHPFPMVMGEAGDVINTWVFGSITSAVLEQFAVGVPEI